MPTNITTATMDQDDALRFQVWFERNLPDHPGPLAKSNKVYDISRNKRVIKVFFECFGLTKEEAIKVNERLRRQEQYQ